MLLGGTTGAETTGYHDWKNILNIMNIMHLDHRIADTVDGLGVLIMLTAFGWGCLFLYKQFKTMH